MQYLPKHIYSTIHSFNVTHSDLKTRNCRGRHSQLSVLLNSVFIKMIRSVKNALHTATPSNQRSRGWLKTGSRNWVKVTAAPSCAWPSERSCCRRVGIRCRRRSWSPGTWNGGRLSWCPERGATPCRRWRPTCERPSEHLPSRRRSRAACESSTCHHVTLP